MLPFLSQLKAWNETSDPTKAFWDFTFVCTSAAARLSCPLITWYTDEPDTGGLSIHVQAGATSWPQGGCNFSPFSAASQVKPPLFFRGRSRLVPRLPNSKTDPGRPLIRVTSKCVDLFCFNQCPSAYNRKKGNFALLWEVRKINVILKKLCILLRHEQR